MKIIEKLSLTIFSILILILSLVMCLLAFGWLKTSTVLFLLQTALAMPTAVNIILVVSVILMLLAIKCIFFSSTTKENSEKSDGKVILDNVTISNLMEYCWKMRMENF